MKHRLVLKCVTQGGPFAPKGARMYQCVCGTAYWLVRGKDGVERAVSFLGSATCPGEWEVSKRAREALEGAK